MHGNASLLDEEVLKLAGITVGDPVPEDALKAIERRLKDSDRFDTVEVRKRYRSLDDPTDVAIILLVHERPGVTSASLGSSNPLQRPWRRMTSRLMFLPILNYADGYGFTYGGRVSTSICSAWASGCRCPSRGAEPSARRSNSSGRSNRGR